jgi:hypothetical protein
MNKDQFKAAVDGKSKGIAYIAGPMRGLPEYNFPAFHEAEAVLREAGWETFNPARDDEEAGFDPKAPDAEVLPLKHYMHKDLPMVCESDAVFVLPGWEGSEGARLELIVAHRCEIPVFRYAEFRDYSIYSLVDVEHDPKDSYPATVLTEAIEAVDDRAGAYGHPADHFEITVGLINAAFGTSFEPKDWPVIMALDKIARMQGPSDRRDNMVDVCGYMRTREKVLERKEQAAGDTGAAPAEER